MSNVVDRVEAYVDRRQLAEIMRVSTKTIQRWEREGLPFETWGFTRLRRYLPSSCIAWAQGRAEARTISPLLDDHNVVEQPQSKE